MRYSTRTMFVNGSLLPAGSPLPDDVPDPQRAVVTASAGGETMRDEALAHQPAPPERPEKAAPIEQATPPEAIPPDPVA